jgi:hypothetical protein
MQRGIFPPRLTPDPNVLFLFSWVRTLGLLERLRSEANLVRGAYGGLYERLDKLLRELENPNLHDIANMSFRVELWDRRALHIRWVVAASGSVFVARAAFDEAVKHWPDQKLTLRQGIMLIREHPDPPQKR